jgi:hypothetical protein
LKADLMENKLDVIMAAVRVTQKVFLRVDSMGVD